MPYKKENIFVTLLLVEMEVVEISDTEGDCVEIEDDDDDDVSPKVPQLPELPDEINVLSRVLYFRILLQPIVYPTRTASVPYPAKLPYDFVGEH